MNTKNATTTYYFFKIHGYSLFDYFTAILCLEASNMKKILENGYFALLAELRPSHFSLYGSNL